MSHQSNNYSVGGAVGNASFGASNGSASFSYGGSSGSPRGGSPQQYGGASFSSGSASYGSGSVGGAIASAGSSEISRVLPAELANAQGYGQFETVQSLSAQSAGAVDRQLLEHENPNNCTDLAPALPLDQYKLNLDQNPHIIRKKANEKLQYLQEVSVRYLKPPQAPKSGDIIIRQLASKQHAPAPPLIVRQQGAQAPTPAPLIIREAPPQPPQPLPGKTITIPGKTVPPPARKVIVERLPPVPPKPQQVFIERWLPYGEQRQRVVFQQCKAPCTIPDPKNVIIVWDAPDVEVRREVKNLGVQQADPQEYIQRYGSQLVRADALPEIARQYSQQQGVVLAAAGGGEAKVVLEGDVQALRLIDLDANGLGHLRQYLGAAGASGSASSAIAGASGVSSWSSGGDAGNWQASSGGQSWSSGNAGAGASWESSSASGGYGGYEAQY